jgi:hypothetical protein
MSKSKQVTVANSGAMVEERPAWMDAGSARGNEAVAVEDMTVPRLSIIQDLSPQHKKGKAEYIEGAKPKMIFNTVTNELYGESVFIVPVLFRKEYVVWKDINSGGGFKGAYPTMQEALDAREELDDRDQCEVVDTAQHFVLILDSESNFEDPRFTTAVISMSKSQMKVSRRINSMIQQQGGDRWSRVFRLSVVDDANASGQEFYSWQPHQMGYVSEAIFKAAEKLYEDIRSGAMDIKRDEMAAAEASHGEGAVTEDDDF